MMQTETTAPAAYCNTDELCRRTGLSRAHIRALTAQGRIPFLTAGRCRKYNPAAVLQALQAEAQLTAQAAAAQAAQATQAAAGST